MNLTCDEKNINLRLSNSTYVNVNMRGFYVFFHYTVALSRRYTYRSGGYYHHVSKNSPAATPIVVNTSDTHCVSLETCIIVILTRWYGHHCTLTVASGHILK